MVCPSMDLLALTATCDPRGSQGHAQGARFGLVVELGRSAVRVDIVYVFGDKPAESGRAQWPGLSGGIGCGQMAGVAGGAIARDLTVAAGAALRACSWSSSTSMAAASEITRPSRAESKGRQARVGSGLRESTRRLDQPPRTLPQMGRRRRPASTTVSSPWRMRRKASPSATAPEAQAAATVKWLPPACTGSRDCWTAS
jgi:hypothetical protein